MKQTKKRVAIGVCGMLLSASMILPNVSYAKNVEKHSVDKKFVDMKETKVSEKHKREINEKEIQFGIDKNLPITLMKNPLIRIVKYIPEDNLGISITKKEYDDWKNNPQSKNLLVDKLYNKLNYWKDAESDYFKSAAKVLLMKMLDDKAVVVKETDDILKKSFEELMPKTTLHLTKSKDASLLAFSTDLMKEDGKAFDEDQYEVDTSLIGSVWINVKNDSLKGMNLSKLVEELSIIKDPDSKGIYWVLSAYINNNLTLEDVTPKMVDKRYIPLLTESTVDISSNPGKVFNIHILDRKDLRVSEKTIVVKKGEDLDLSSGIEIRDPLTNTWQPLNTSVKKDHFNIIFEKPKTDEVGLFIKNIRVEYLGLYDGELKGDGPRFVDFSVKYKVVAKDTPKPVTPEKPKKPVTPKPVESKTPGVTLKPIKTTPKNEVKDSDKDVVKKEEKSKTLDKMIQNPKTADAGILSEIGILITSGFAFASVLLKRKK